MRAPNLEALIGPELETKAKKTKTPESLVRVQVQVSALRRVWYRK